MNKSTRLLIAFLLACAILRLSRASAEEAPRYTQRWFYAMHNLLVDKNVDQLIALIERAGKCGYNGVVLADYKFNILDRMPAHYFQNVARVRKAADTAKIEIIPCVFPVGYSDGLLAHDPNLAEGMPVQSAPFVIKDGVAVLAPGSAPRLVNGGLEQVKGDRFAGFSLQDDPGKTSFADHEIHHGGKVSCRMQDIDKQSSHGNCRLAQRVKVRPHACYRFSCWVKTRDLAPLSAFHLLALGTSKGNRALTFHESKLKPTQDWTQLDVVFNSLDENEVQLYAGQWNGRTGTLWVDDLALEELALVNVLRRPGCPLVVTTEDGTTVYEEGKDFQPVSDPKLGNDPYAGQYSFAHQGATLRLTDKSRIKEGDKIRISWYHPVLVHGSQMMCCLSEPKVVELLRDQARRVNDLLHPQTFFMSHDEVRVANWCATCQKTHQTPGALFAANVGRCVEILKDLNPRARIVVWSDMFDPHHNAVDRYFLANGSLRESWKGLPEDVVIANWNGGKARDSLKWFAERGHAQIIAGYYDHGLDNLRKWNAAAKGVPKVTGFMYTTWDHKYDLLEAYGKALLGEK
ncbi:MAG TPA: hypothetical protein VH682_08055 [Gemmataceae bacterium]|jgi:hypothetical protein